jgi:Spy/CpxP family protein refolding chaperone
MFMTAFMAVGSLQISAQSTAAPESKPKPERKTGEKRPDLFRELGVTREQLEQIRTLRRQGREEFTAAQKQLREANKALDAAIYSDVLDEQLIEQLISQRNEAEAAMSRLRTMSELNLRKILTPEQVVKFREIRSRFAKREAEIRDNRRRRPDADGEEMPPPPPPDDEQPRSDDN